MILEDPTNFLAENAGPHRLNASISTIMTISDATLGHLAMAERSTSKDNFYENRSDCK